MATNTAGGTTPGGVQDQLGVTLVVAKGGQAYGPISETWTIAPGRLEGTIYYNSYGTTLVTNSSTDGLDYYGKQYGAGTLSIQPGATSPTRVAGVNSINPTGNGTGCRVCHTVSADGKGLVTQASQMSVNYSETVYINLANDTTEGAGTALRDGQPRVSGALPRTASLLFSELRGHDKRRYVEPALRTARGHARRWRHGTERELPGVATGLLPGREARVVQLLGRHAHCGNGHAPERPGLARDPRLRREQGVLESPVPLHAVRRGVGHVLVVPPEQRWRRVRVRALESFEAVGLHLVGRNTGELWWVDVTTGKAHRLDLLNGYTAGGHRIPAWQQRRRRTTPSHLGSRTRPSTTSRR